MNKLILGALLFGLATTAQAKDYGAAGCGLGSKLFEGQSGVGPHVLAATTNGFYGTQTFAMTSGTLGCDVSDPIKSHMAHYIDSNLDNIAQAAARGEGESLDALASVMNIEKEDQDLFSSTIQSNFDVIFSSESVGSVEVMNALTAVMKSNEKLAKYVS
jgi:hypothetical protein